MHHYASQLVDLLLALVAAWMVLAIIFFIWQRRGLPNPCKTDIVLLTLRGIRRVHGRPQSQVRPLLKTHLEAVVQTFGSSLRDRRDNALLMIGFYGALRRSEIVALRVGSFCWLDEALMVTISKSKTDQESRGRQIASDLHLAVRSKPYEIGCVLQESATGRSFGPLTVMDRSEDGRSRLKQSTLYLSIGWKKRASPPQDTRDTVCARASLRKRSMPDGHCGKFESKPGTLVTQLSNVIRHEGIKRELFTPI
jgi:hypothetical protein